MKQIPKNTHTIAWFKIAEYVSRGERERALGVYRLLSHSFDDAAVALQLEGDILWSFNDVKAVEKYQQAATLYAEQNRLLEAAAVYEHLITLQPDTAQYYTQLIELYTTLGLEKQGAGVRAAYARIQNVVK